MELSKKQVSTMELINKIGDRFGIARWFTQAELLGVTKHTMDALVSKKLLCTVVYEGIVYYHQMKELGDES